MPSILANLISEPVSLVSSDTSPYEPPHRSSQEKSSRRSSGTNGAALNGFAVDSTGTSKKIEGVIFKGPKGANSSLHSLPDGRTSESTDGRGKPHSRNGSGFSIPSGPNGVAENGRRSPAPMGALSKQHVMNNSSMASPLRNSLEQPSRPKSPEKGQIRGHGRAHSSSAPQSPTPYPIQLPSTDVAMQASTQTPLSAIEPQPPNRLSGPSNISNTISHHAGSPSSSVQPTAPRLQHRHTLQVPKAPANRTSREYPSPIKTSSEDPDGIGRGSMSLGRRPTRSLQSDMFLDDIPQDADTARWTEAIRQRRANRKQRKEEEEDDRVVVGTKVDMHHVNWVTAYNMLTGIRFTVSRTNAKLDHELTDEDFIARNKFSFDM